MCQPYVPSSVAEQFPTLMPSLFPGALAHREVLPPCVDAMWSAFGRPESKWTPAIGGKKYSTTRSQPNSVPS